MNLFSVFVSNFKVYLIDICVRKQIFVHIVLVGLLKYQSSILSKLHIKCPVPSRRTYCYYLLTTTVILPSRHSILLPSKHFPLIGDAPYCSRLQLTVMLTQRLTTYQSSQNKWPWSAHSQWDVHITPPVLRCREYCRKRDRKITRATAWWGLCTTALVFSHRLWHRPDDHHFRAHRILPLIENYYNSWRMLGEGESVLFRVVASYSFPIF